MVWKAGETAECLLSSSLGALIILFATGHMMVR